MGLRKLFKRLLKSGKEADLRSEPVEATEDYASGSGRSQELTFEASESEEKFHEEELQSLETLSDDTWIYEEGVAEPQYSDTSTSVEKKPDKRGGLSDVDAPFGKPATADKTLALGEHAEGSLPSHDLGSEKAYYEEEQRWFESLRDEVQVYEEEIATPTDRSAPYPKELLPSSNKVSGLALGEPSSQPDRGGFGRRRQRLSLKKSRANSSPHRSARIGHKIFVSNKDVETDQCLPPRTTQDPYSTTCDATLPVEEESAKVKQDTSNTTNEPSLTTTDSTQITLRTDSDSQPALQNTSTSVMRDENATDISCLDEASAAWGQVRLPVLSEENQQPLITRDLEEGEGSLVVLENRRKASLGPATAEQSTVATRLVSEAGRLQQPNPQHQHAEEEYGQEPLDYLFDDQDDYRLIAFFDDDIYDQEPLEDFALDSGSLEEFEGLTEDEGYGFDVDLTDHELLEELLPDEGADQNKPERISQYLRACQRAAEFIRKNHWDDGYLRAC